MAEFTKDDAIKWLDNLTQDIGQMRHQDLWDYAQALSYICQMIDEMPEIVRCKDCTYGIENGELCGRKVYLCSCMTNPNEFYGDFYCESGERRETE